MFVLALELSAPLRSMPRGAKQADLRKTLRNFQNFGPQHNNTTPTWRRQHPTLLSRKMEKLTISSRGQQITSYLLRRLHQR